jgi:hypothetical protein
MLLFRLTVTGSFEQFNNIGITAFLRKEGGARVSLFVVSLLILLITAILLMI